MRIVHWTDNEEFVEDDTAIPEPIDTAGEGPGLFVYPAPPSYEEEFDELGWPRRRPIYFEIARKYMREIQRFEKNEFGPGSPPHKIIELFVPAENFDKLRRL